MSQHYSDPSRESDPHALPDVEVFYVTRDDVDRECNNEALDSPITESGWYYWFCLPGCLPDSEPFGPFASEQDALDDACDR